MSALELFNEILDTHFLNKNKYTFKQVYKYKIGGIIMKSLIFLLIGACLFFAIASYIHTSLEELTDENRHAKSALESTEEVKGIVIEKDDKSYMKKEDSFLFVGGGERKIEDYQLKVKYQTDKFKTIKVEEKNYLNYNKSDDIDIVIDTNSNEIKYNLQDKEDKKIYEEYKRLIN